MPKKASGEFDQLQYIQEWKKGNMLQVGASYRRDFVLQFREACEKLGVKQSEVIRQAMIDTIEKADE